MGRTKTFELPGSGGSSFNPKTVAGSVNGIVCYDISPPARPPPALQPPPAPANMISTSAFPHGAGTADKSLFPTGDDDNSSEEISLPDGSVFTLKDVAFGSYSVNTNGFLVGGISAGDEVGTTSKLPYTGVSDGLFVYWQDWDTRPSGSSNTPNGEVYSRVEAGKTSADHVMARDLLNSFFGRSKASTLDFVAVTTWVQVAVFDRRKTVRASFQVMLAGTASSSYACFIYGALPAASVTGDSAPTRYSRSGYQYQAADGTYSAYEFPGSGTASFNPKTAVTGSKDGVVCFNTS